MARVELEGVSKVFPGGVKGVEAIDLAVKQGELVVLVGPSGSGKTTTLRLIAGLERPTSGKIRIGGQEVTNVAPRHRDVAYLPQSSPLYPHLRVYDNVAFGGRMRHAGSLLTRWWRHVVRRPDDLWTKAELDRRVREAAGKLGIGHLLERWPRQLSGGERQRVALARALVREPAAFLFDEPLSSLDGSLRSTLRQEISRLHEETGGTFIYVTHDQAEALTLAERLAVLERGKLRQIGPPAEVYDKPKHRFVASFLGSPPMNLLTGTVQRKKANWSFSTGSWEIELSHDAAERLNGEVELGIRPEAIELVPAVGAKNVADVARVETLGDVKLAYLRPVTEKVASLIVKLPAAVRIATGERVAWQSRWSDMHWFHHKTGERIEN